MIAKNIQLRIVRPRDGLYYGLVSSKAILKIKTQAFSGQTSISDVKFKPLLEGCTVAIMLDGVHATTADHVKNTKATYDASVNLRTLPDGPHTLQAVIQQKGSAPKPEQIVDSEIVNFIIDRDPPAITSVLPSAGMSIEDRAFSRVLVEASGGLTGLYTKLSSVAIDKKVYKNPVEHKKGLVFSIPIPPKQGTHTLKLTVFDKAGNKATRQCKFKIIETAAQEEEQDWQERKGVVEEKLISDIRFQKKLLTDARAAFAENGIPFAKAASSVLPPPFTEEHADFFANVDSAMASQKWEALLQRAFEESPNRNNERIAQIREKLGSQKPTTEDGNLTSSAKDMVSEILQDPNGFFQSLNVTASVEEKQFVFPSFSAINANAFADWFSMTLAGKPAEPSEDRQANLQEISSRVANDPDLLFRWLTKPVETYKEIYPDATARDIALLPSPVSEEEARQIVGMRSPATAVPTQPITPHNSSDIVVGFSMNMLNEILELYFTTLQPGVLPKTTKSNFVTALPSPYANISCEITIDQPGNLKVHDMSAKLLSVTASGSATVTVGDDTVYSYSLSLTPVYAILLKEDKVFLKFDSIDVVVTNKGTGIPDAGASNEIKNFIEKEVRSKYPNGEIYLVDQKPMNVNIPFADVAVDIHRIWVHDDTDPGGSGELYFGITVDDKEYLFGQFDADSGSTIEISRRFMLKKEGSSFPVQIQGIDMDIGVWPDTDDPLGGSMRLNAMSAPGTYTLRGVIPVTSYEMVWDFVDFALKVVCWLVEAFVAIFNWLFAWAGWKIEIKCNSWIEKIMGWIRKAHTENVHTYTLEYSIVPLYPVPISIAANEPQLDDKALYLSFDFSIPEIGELVGLKTNAVGFMGSADLGIALSDNLLNKIISAWWKYSPIPKRITTPYGTRLFYANLELDKPQIVLQTDKVWLNIATAGVAGTNLGPAHISLDLPAGVLAGILLTLEGRNLVFKIDNIWFLGSNVATFLANFIALFAYNFKFLDKQLIDKKTIVMDIAPNLRFGVQGAEYELNPTEGIRINKPELIMKFSTVITPSIRMEPRTLNFFREYKQTVTLKNVGNEMLKITGFVIDDNVFSLVNLPVMPLNIRPNEEAVITIQVIPSWTGLHRGKLSIHNNDPANLVAIVDLIAPEKPIIEVTTFYNGIMGGAPFWAPATWLYFDQYNGSREIFIRNKGHANLIVKNVSIENRFFSSDGLPSAEVAFTPVTLSPYTTSPGADEVVEIRLSIKIDVNKLHAPSFGSDGTIENGILKIESEDLETPLFITSLYAQYLAPAGSQK